MRGTFRSFGIATATLATSMALAACGPSEEKSGARQAGTEESGTPGKPRDSSTPIRDSLAVAFADTLFQNAEEFQRRSLEEFERKSLEVAERLDTVLAEIHATEERLQKRAAALTVREVALAEKEGRLRRYRMISWLLAGAGAVALVGAVGSRRRGRRSASLEGTEPKAAVVESPPKARPAPAVVPKASESAAAAEPRDSAKSANTRDRRTPAAKQDKDSAAKEEAGAGKDEGVARKQEDSARAKAADAKAADAKAADAKAADAKAADAKAAGAKARKKGSRAKSKRKDEK